MKALIVAVDELGGIGKDGKIPWHYKDDFDNFKKVTKDAVCIMGYRTYKEIAEKFDYQNTGKFLPNRVCLVVTSHNIPETPQRVLAVHSVEEAVYYAECVYPEKNIFFLGGTKIFEESVKYLDKAYITVVKGDYKCDTFFPLSTFEQSEKFLNAKPTVTHNTDDLVFWLLEEPKVNE